MWLPQLVTVFASIDKPNVYDHAFDSIAKTIPKGAFIIDVY